MLVVAAMTVACEDAALVGRDGGPDARDVTDSGADAGVALDAGGSRADAGLDAEPEDAAAPEGGADAGAPRPPALRAPWNGAHTGSALALGTLAARDPLRPALVWEPVAGAARYEVQLGSGCRGDELAGCALDVAVVPVSETRFAPGPALEVDTTPPVGRRYHWRVRTCTGDGACGPFGETRYLDVGRQGSDFDGDGHADAVVVANVSYDAGEVAAVYVYRGSVDGLLEAEVVRLDPPFDEPGASFGSAVAALGDVDGDDFADLAVGASRYDGGRGAVFVYLGGPGGLATVPSATLELDAADGEAGFGTSVVGPGDLDGDGFADLVVGAPLHAGGGSVHVYRGGPGGPSGAPAATLAQPRTTRFGSALAGVGDSDGDGLPDLLVGDFWHSSRVTHGGRAYLWRGARGSVLEGPTLVLDDPEREPDAETGFFVAGPGDLDGDGLTELAVSSHFHDAEAAGEGVVFVYHGSAIAIATDPELTLSSPQDTEGAEHGARIAGGDLDGDGLDDLVLGTYFARGADGTAEVGRVYVHAGNRARIGVAPSYTVESPAAAPSRFGSYVSVLGDVDGDGYPELLVGALLQPAQPGRGQGGAFVYRGGPGDLRSRPPQRLDCPDPDHAWFGWWAAGSGPF